MATVKGARHKQAHKEFKRRKRAQKERKPFCEWDTKRSLKKKVERLEGGLLIREGELSAAKAEYEGLKERYKQMFEENRKLAAENKALQAALENRLDVTDDGYAREEVSA